MAMERQFRLLLLALGAMFAQQTFASIGRGLPAVVAPAVIADLHIDPAWFGTYVSLSALAALTFQLGCGSFLIRHGALRMSQVALVMLGIGLAAAASGNMLLFIVSAVIGGGGAAVSTPASSHLLGRYCPPRTAPLVYSVKQTAVPAGLLLGGLLGPALIGWTGFLIVVPPDLPAKGYVLLDAFSGRVLVGHNDTERLEPASLTKLMTAYVVFQALHDGKLKLEVEAHGGSVKLTMVPGVYLVHALEHWRQTRGRELAAAGERVLDIDASAPYAPPDLGLAAAAPTSRC
jgi:MFS family permease